MTNGLHRWNDVFKRIRTIFTKCSTWCPNFTSQYLSYYYLVEKRILLLELAEIGAICKFDEIRPLATKFYFCDRHDDKRHGRFVTVVLKNVRLRHDRFENGRFRNATVLRMVVLCHDRFENVRCET